MELHSSINLNEAISMISLPKYIYLWINFIVDILQFF